MGSNIRKARLHKNPRGRNIITLKKNYGQIGIKNYNTGFGVKYLSFQGAFNCEVNLENKHFLDNNFLCFNAGGTFRIKETKSSEWFKWDPKVSLSGEQHIRHISTSLHKKGEFANLRCIGFDLDLFQDITQDSERFHKA